MKKILTVFAFILLFAGTANAEDIMKISMNGEVKAAKDIGTGKGISFVLPELSDKEYRIAACELAVFEKQEQESNYHIFKDSNGIERKKIIDAPAGLAIQVDFGDISEYRDKAKYKIAYRYMAEALSDTSKLLIVGEDEKDGFRLIGEGDGINATENGFCFYKNADPRLSLECINYTIHTPDGDLTASCDEESVDEKFFPSDIFKNGITVQCTANDYDAEDNPVISYVMKDGDTEEIIQEGILPDDGFLQSNTDAEVVQLQLIVRDEFGGTAEGKLMSFHIIKTLPAVTSEFNDYGYAVRGKILFSDFYTACDERLSNQNSSVTAVIERDGEFVSRELLTDIGNGVFRLNKTGMADGEYTVKLKIFDFAGNVSEHTFTQKLDGTNPTARFITSEENPEATDYMMWINQNKKIMIELDDSMTGVKKLSFYLINKIDYSKSMSVPRKEYTYIREVPGTKTGKLRYYGYIYDDAKTINKTDNTVNIKSNGNSLYVNKYVWLDKTSPTIAINHNDNCWSETPFTVTADIIDYPSGSGLDDASGVKSKYYAVTETEEEPTQWNVYTDKVDITDGGVYYVHFKAVDYAGNETTKSCRVRTNTPSRIIGNVTPTDDYRHTIYYSESAFYVVKNTAYNTKYHFPLEERDLNDIIKTNVKLVSRDNANKFSVSQTESVPTGELQRDIIFNLSYIDGDGNQLPDGVYDMYLTISEIKNDSETILTYNNESVCQVVIKRNAPPTPIISVDSGFVTIDYPVESLSGSLNTPQIRSRYKYQYKKVAEGQPDTNVYRDYTDRFETEDMVVTALYTDIAGNTSTATNRIFADDVAPVAGVDIVTDGDNTTVEESRPANVYYIGIRREKNKAINADIFDFIN